MNQKLQRKSTYFSVTTWQVASSRPMSEAVCRYNSGISGSSCVPPCVSVPRLRQPAAPRTGHLRTSFSICNHSGRRDTCEPPARHFGLQQRSVPGRALGEAATSGTAPHLPRTNLGCCHGIIPSSSARPESTCGEACGQPHPTSHGSAQLSAVEGNGERTRPLPWVLSARLSSDPR